MSFSALSKTYAATLQKRRADRAQRSLEPRKRGPKESAEAKKIKRLNAEVAMLSRRLEQSEDIIEDEVSKFHQEPVA